MTLRAVPSTVVGVPSLQRVQRHSHGRPPAGVLDLTPAAHRATLPWGVPTLHLTLKDAWLDGLHDVSVAEALRQALAFADATPGTLLVLDAGRLPVGAGVALAVLAHELRDPHAATRQARRAYLGTRPHPVVVRLAERMTCQGLRRAERRRALLPS